MWDSKAPAAASPPRQPNDTEFPTPVVPKPDFKEHTFWGPPPDLLNPSLMVETENLFLIIFFFCFQVLQMILKISPVFRNHRSIQLMVIQKPKNKFKRTCAPRPTWLPTFVVPQTFAFWATKNSSHLHHHPNIQHSAHETHRFFTFWSC